MKVSELEGAELDYWVAKGMQLYNINALIDKDGKKITCFYGAVDRKIFAPSTDPSQGWPIIERIGGFELKIWLESGPDTRCEAHIHNYDINCIYFGPTSLIAAMRAYVASKFGDEV